MPDRHAERGFRSTVVSTIDKGAGSVDVSARPALPKTRRTSGVSFSRASIVRRSVSISVIDTPGRVIGMYRSVPSSSGGMNSRPSPR